MPVKIWFLIESLLNVFHYGIVRRCRFCFSLVIQHRLSYLFRRYKRDFLLSSMVHVGLKRVVDGPNGQLEYHGFATARSRETFISCHSKFLRVFVNTINFLLSELHVTACFSHVCVCTCRHRRVYFSNDIQRACNSILGTCRSCG